MPDSMSSPKETQLISTAFMSAVRETFELVLELDNLEVGEPNSQHFAYPDLVLSQLATKGGLRGGVLLETSVSCARYLVSKMLEIDGDELSAEEIVDGWGELNNIITGNAKGALSEAGYGFELGLPRVTFGNPDPKILDSENLIVIPLTSGEHSLSLTLNVEAQRGQRTRFLVVDDSSTMRRIIVRSLQKIGYDDVTQAANGVEALDHIEQSGPFDMILSDWNMPKMDGYEFLCKVREADSRTPFMMVTTESGKDSLVKAIQAGANHYIVKPFDGKGLQKRIEQALQQLELLAE